MNYCTFCEKPLTGGRDTYGAHGCPECWDCFWTLREGDKQSWYGLAPHRHNLTKTDSFIGSTEFEVIADKLDANGNYDCGDGFFFRPDREDAHMGVYFKQPSP